LLRFMPCLFYLLIIGIGTPFVSAQEQEAGPSPEQLRTWALQPYEAPASASPEDWPNERLRDWMRQLTEEVVDRHLVLDEDRRIFGHVYEWWKDGKQYRAFAINSMHDGIWFGSTLATLHRLDPSYEPYLETNQQYLVPFFTNMLIHSDIIFPNKKRMTRREDREIKEPQEPVTGWVPRGWDDGEGYDLITRQQFKTGNFSGQGNDLTTTEYDAQGNFFQAYSTPSNHLTQYLADGLLNIWWTTRDPRIERAVRHLHENRLEYMGQPIRLVQHAYGVMHDELANIKPPHPPSISQWNPNAHHPGLLFTGLYLQRPGGMPAFFDNGIWYYRVMVADAIRSAPDPSVAWMLAWSVNNATTTHEIFYDDRPYHFGDYRFQALQPNFRAQKGTGALATYRSGSTYMNGGMGLTYPMTIAAVLPVLRQSPDAWSKRYRERFSDHQLVRFVDAPPVTDGQRDAAYDQSASVNVGPTTVSLVADPKNLHVFVRSGRPTVTLTIEPKPVSAAVGPLGHATLTLHRDGTASVANADQQALWHDVAVAGDGDMWAGEVRIPYGAIHGQGKWTTFTDHGRYELTVGDAEPVKLYALSTPERMIARARAIALGTVDRWHQHWEEAGYLPNAWPTSDRDESYSRHMHSDVSTYNHVMGTAAYLWMDRLGQTEWSLIEAQRPKDPLKAQPLPESVRQMLGTPANPGDD